MKNSILTLSLLVTVICTINAQTMMNIHQNNGTVLQIPINTIDSITYDTSFSGSISFLDCNNVNNTGTLAEGISVNSFSFVNSQITYTGGNGGPYNSQTISSTNVTGLTAILDAGTFSNGTGSLTLRIIGTPAGNGLASFLINIGGQSCTFSVNVLPSPSLLTYQVTGITSNSATFSGEITNANGTQITERGFVYSVVPNTIYTGSANSQIIVGSGVGAFDTIIPLKGLNTALVGSYNNNMLQPNTTYYVRTYVKHSTNLISYGNEFSFTTLTTGQTGPGGGIVFFDKGNYNGGWRYLEAAPTDQSSGIEWGCFGTSSITGTIEDIGSGQSNTTLIVNGCNDVSFAAKLCDNLNIGGQSDWFLPSLQELSFLYWNTRLLGIFNTSSSYWSSTEWPGSNGNAAAIINFYNGGTGIGMGNDIFHVRAIRAY